MTDINFQGNAMLLPAGTLPKEPFTGDLILKITDVMPENGVGIVSEFNMVQVTFPNEFVKHYQTNDMVDLLTKVLNTVKGKYQFGNCNVVRVPAMAVGESIILNLEV